MVGTKPTRSPRARASAHSSARSAARRTVVGSDAVMAAVMVRWVSRFAADLIMCQCPKHLSKGHASMPSRYLHRPILCGALPALVAGVLAACGGRGPLDTDIESYDSPDAAGLRTPGDDEIEPGGDSGTGPTRPLDGGASSKDAGTPGSPGSPGSPGLPG